MIYKISLGTTGRYFCVIRDAVTFEKQRSILSVTHRKNIITHNKESVPDFELKFFIYIYEIMKREIISMELFRKVYFKTRKEEINKLRNK